MTHINRKLELPPDEMRQLGYQVVDMLVEHYQAVVDKPVKAYSKSSRETIEMQFSEPPPSQGMDVQMLLQSIHDDVLEQNYHRIHPRDFAYVNAPSNFVSVLADTLVAGYNVFAGAWVASPAATMIELVTLDWLRELIGMPESTGGIFTTGGSVANLTGLAVARHIKLADDMTDAVVYFSEQTHASVAKALRLLGFHDDHIRKLPVDSDFRLAMPSLYQAFKTDISDGKRPFCVVASAGTTNTGTVDPLPQIAQFCQENALWLHIDGAYGTAGVLADKGRTALQGIEFADSLAIDPHKWLFQPYEMGCTLVKDRQHLWETFNVAAEYLKNLVDPTLQEVNFYDYGLQMTRKFRALKLWMSIKAFGIEAFQAAVSHGIELAEIAQQYLQHSSKWQIVTPAQLGIITFRYVAEDLSAEQLDAVNEEITERIIADGFAFVHSTLLNERTTLRLVTINPRTTNDDIRETLRRMEQFGNAIVKEVNLL